MNVSFNVQVNVVYSDDVEVSAWKVLGFSRSYEPTEDYLQLPLGFTKL